ncbi:MAG: VPLPA-CTERM sorting domain-containing protein [Gammaproteobacteria bacterium]
MIKRTSAGALAGLLLTGMSAQGATIASAQLVDLYSATFDGALTPDPTLFFGGDPSLNPRNIAITPISGTGSGTIVFDGTTISQLNIVLPQLRLDINGGPGTETTVLTNGNPITLDISTPATDNTPGFAGFQVEGAPNIIADFATFSTIVNASDPNDCYSTAAGPGTAGPLCGLIGILTLDGVRYQLDGTVTPGGGDNLLLTVQTGNNSIYEIAITTAAVPVPAAVWLFGSALGLLGWMRRRAA